MERGILLGTTVRTTPSAGMTRIRFIGSSAFANLSALEGSPLLDQHKRERTARKMELAYGTFRRDMIFAVPSGVMPTEAILPMLLP